jgi:D-glycero-alpha-D-manno-heptose-7-phosphate kinase
MDPASGTVEAVAPLRVSFVGGGTDFPHWYEEHGGAVLSATIDHFVRVRVSPRSDRTVSVRSLDLGRLVEYHLDDGPGDSGALELATAAIARVAPQTGVDVSISSEAPPGSGLGGSSALVTAVVAGLAMVSGRRIGRVELAELCYKIEREDLGISGGRQDQYSSAFGGVNLLEFDEAGVQVYPIPVTPRELGELQGRLLLCYTGSVRRNVGLIDRQIEMHRQGREETHLGLKRLQAMAYDMRDALVDGRFDELGAMLGDAFQAKKLMNPHIAEHTAIDAMLEAAHRAGATGGKICGAGGGGYLLISCPKPSRSAVRAALERLGGQLAPFRFFPLGVRARRGAETWAPGG